jgi:hypothetical protein
MVMRYGMEPYDMRTARKIGPRKKTIKFHDLD